MGIGITIPLTRKCLYLMNEPIQHFYTIEIPCSKLFLKVLFTLIELSVGKSQMCYVLVLYSS